MPSSAQLRAAWGLCNDKVEREVEIMNASFNRVILLGNLTRDIELRHTQNGTAVTEIGLAVNNRRKTQDGEWIDEPVFVDVTLWGRTAEVAAEYLAKGSPVHIEGRLKLDTWETDGQKRSKLRIIGESLQMLGKGESKSGRGLADANAAATSSTLVGASLSDGNDVPF